MAEVKESKTETISAKVSTSTAKKLRRMAKQQDRPISYIINQMVTKYFAESVK